MFNYTEVNAKLNEDMNYSFPSSDLKQCPNPDLNVQNGLRQSLTTGAWERAQNEHKIRVSHQLPATLLLFHYSNAPTPDGHWKGNQALCITVRSQL